MAATILGQAGYLVNVAADAQGAIASAVKAPPRVILSAVTLPALDGRPWWERLRSIVDGRVIPFVFLTAPGVVAADIRGFLRRDRRLPGQAVPRRGARARGAGRAAARAPSGGRGAPSRARRAAAPADGDAGLDARVAVAPAAAGAAGRAQRDRPRQPARDAGDGAQVGDLDHRDRHGDRALLPAQGAHHARRARRRAADVGRDGRLRRARLERGAVRVPDRRRRRRRRDPDVDDVPAHRGRAPRRRAQGAGERRTRV